MAGIASPSLEEMDIDWARTSSDTVVAHPKMADVQLYDCIALVLHGAGNCGANQENQISPTLKGMSSE